MSQLTEEQFDEKYPLIKNEITNGSSWDGHMFETYGKELEFVKSFPDNQVWTWVSGGDGDCLIAGMAMVNRIGYLISSKPREHDNEWVDLEEETEMDSLKLYFDNGRFYLSDIDGNIIDNTEDSIDMDSSDDANTLIDCDINDEEYELRVTWDREDQDKEDFKPYASLTGVSGDETEIEVVMQR